MTRVKRRWAYVICEAEDQGGGDKFSSFRHCFVDADSEEEAYTIGANTLRQPRGNGIGDYVFEVPDSDRPLIAGLPIESEEEVA